MKIRWNWGVAAVADVFKTANQRVARMKEVKKAVNDRAKVLGARARTLLASHRDTGSARITVTRGKVDSWVSLEDPNGNALAIEYGRAAGTSSSGRSYGAMQGLYILHRTIGLR